MKTMRHYALMRAASALMPTPQLDGLSAPLNVSRKVSTRHARVRAPRLRAACERCRLTGWRSALSIGYAWIPAIRFGIRESATFLSHTPMAFEVPPRLW